MQGGVALGVKRKPSKKRVLIPLYLSMGTIFTAIVIIIFLAITWNTHREGSEAALDMADRFFREVTGKTIERMNRLLGSVSTLADAASAMPGFAEEPIYDGLAHKGLEFLIRVLEAQDHVYSVYVGYGSADFLQVIAPRGDPEVRSNFAAPEETRFIVRAITRDSDGQRKQYWRFLNEERHVIAARTELNPDYDPRKRPWYELGLTASGHVFTDPYVFHSMKQPGITAARRIPGSGGVLGVDITLSDLSSFLSLQKISEHGVVFLFDRDGRIIAHPNEGLVTTIDSSDRTGKTEVSLSNASDSRDSVIQSVFADYKAAAPYDGGIRALDIDGKRHLARVTNMEGEFRDNYRVAVAAPTSDFTGYLRRMQLRNLVFSAIALVAAVPVIVWVSRRIARVLGQLVKEAEKIRQFELEEAITVDSTILEIHRLARAFESMRGGVRTFGRYVPKALVKQIVQSGVTPTLGGKRQELTVMFTDVKDFTTMSEHVLPEDLMKRTSKYFETLGTVIAECGGVVDKYIGDAIMAFWNAPQPDPDHILKACMALLQCRAANDALNAEFTAKSLPVFYTRFGLHCGDTVVGNVGSSDRMNYTAVGATVNIASRLEGLNKFYGTQILVSGVIRERVGFGFLTRPVDLVLPKGAETPIEIYELVAAVPGNDALPQSLWADENEQALCREWEDAYKIYLDRDWKTARSAFEAIHACFPNDPLARVFLGRCQEFEVNPPDPSWNGVTEIKEK
jgi:adenylate cyclase